MNLIQTNISQTNCDATTSPTGADTGCGPEIWKPVVGYEGLYEVSSKGRVRSCDSIRIMHNQSGEHKGYYKGRILKTAITSDGYLYVGLCKNGKQKTYRIHRLVAEAFLPNPDKLPEVNHLSEIKTQNNVENLEWCDHTYNMNYGTQIERVKLLLTNHPNTSKKIIQLTQNNEIVAVWPSMQEASRKKGFDTSAICGCCKGNRNKYKGYKWMYYEDFLRISQAS